MDNAQGGSPILGHGPEAQIANRLLARYDVPAYVRRARRVQDAFEDLLQICARQRTELAQMVRIDLGILKALAGDWENLGPLLAGATPIDLLRDLERELNPRLRVPVTATTSRRALGLALRSLDGSMERFNRRWQDYLRLLDLRSVNELRDGYNRYFILEKECAVRSPHVARQGFEQLEPLTTQDLAERFPLLPRLELA
jgi:hypothetical protein